MLDLTDGRVAEWKQSLQQVQHLVESLKPEEWRLLSQQINAHGFNDVFNYHIWM